MIRRLPILAIAMMATCVNAGQPTANFEETLELHLAAITDRNLAGLESTLTETDDLMVIFPGGTTLDTTAAVVEFHRQWFADSAWVMEPEVIKIIEGSDQSTALIRYQYRDDPEGDPRSAWLVLVFQIENGQWRLIHDQNTRISPAEDS